MQMGFVFSLRMFQDKCNLDCNRDYFQCNRNGNRLHCDFVYSQSQSSRWQVIGIVIDHICAAIAPLNKV